MYLPAGEGGIANKELIKIYGSTHARDDRFTQGAMQAGDLATARAFNDRIYPLAKAIYGTAPGGHANARLKTCLKLLGHIPSDAMRPPMGPLPDGEVAMLAQALKAVGLTTTEESAA